MRKHPKTSASYLENVKIHEQGTAQQQFNEELFSILGSTTMKEDTKYKKYMKAVEALAASFAKELINDNNTLNVYDETLNKVGRILNPRELKNSKKGGFASDIEWFKASYLSNSKENKKYSGINLDVESELYDRLIGPTKKSLSQLQKATAVRKYIKKALKENPKDPEATSALNTIAASGVLSTYIAQYNLMIQKYNKIKEEAQKKKNKTLHNYTNYLDPENIKSIEDFIDIIKKSPSVLVNAGVEKEKISENERDYILDDGTATNASLLEFFDNKGVNSLLDVYKDLTYVKNLLYSMEHAGWNDGIVNAVKTLIKNGYASIISKIFRSDESLEIVFEYDRTKYPLTSSQQLSNAELKFRNNLWMEVSKFASSDSAEDKKMYNDILSQLPTAYQTQKGIVPNPPKKTNRQKEVDKNLKDIYFQ